MSILLLPVLRNSPHEDPAHVPLPWLRLQRLIPHVVLLVPMVLDMIV